MKKILLLVVMVMMTACSDNEKDNKLERVLSANEVISSYHMEMTSDNDYSDRDISQSMSYKDGMAQIVTGGHKQSVTYITDDTQYRLAHNRVVKSKASEVIDVYDEQMKFLKQYKQYFKVTTEQQQIIFTSSRQLLKDKDALTKLNLNDAPVDEFSIEYVFGPDDTLKQYSIERLQKDQKKLYDTVYHYSDVNKLETIDIHPLIKEEMY